MIAVLALSPALDVTYEVESLVIGEINRPTRTTVVAGGKGLNMARVAIAAGADVRVLAMLGGANGRRIRAALDRDGVPVTVVDIAAETRTCLAIVEEQGGASSTDIYDTASPVTAGEWDAFALAAADLRSADGRAADWTTVSGSLPEGVDPVALAAVLADARGRGSRVALDMSGPALQTLAAAGDLVKVNRREASEILGRDLADAASACHALHGELAVDAVVTDGIHPGAALVDGDDLRIPAPSVHGRFPAGSGDAFFAGIVHGLDRGLGSAASVAIAVDLAERNARRPGQGRLAG